MKKAVISAHDVAKSFKQGATIVEVLRSINLSLIQGRSYAITGISGAGKSTLLHILAGLEYPDHGSVIYNDKKIDDFTKKEKEHWLNSTIGMVFQQPYLIAELTVAQNVALKALIQGKRYQDIESWIDQLLLWCNLSDKKNAYPRTLSGGQQQRVALARALCTKPMFLFADEPTGNLDETTGAKLIDLIVQFQQEWDMGLVICSHDAYVVQALQTIYRIADGRLMTEKE